MRATSVADAIGKGMEAKQKEAVLLGDDADRLLAQLEGEMLEAARALEFERAASLRDRIDDVRAAIAQAKGAVAPASTSGRIERIQDPQSPRRIKRRFGKDR
jgi:excinuclease UvrABC nuclease subunit